jgi:N-acetylated-alpha-linked acidic dipeptidase
MLETVHGVGALLRQGWRPKRTIVFCSWDAEEEGLIGSTEWVDQNEKALKHAVAYFNTDIAVSGADFSASAVPSLKDFVRELTRSVPSPLGGTVYEQWRISHPVRNEEEGSNALPAPGEEVHVGDLGSGSDYTPFFQHVGVPATDIGSNGAYGVYHSVFDNFAWFTQNADPNFVYLQQMARVLGLETLRMADTDALPYNYVAYAREIGSYIESAKRKSWVPSDSSWPVRRKAGIAGHYALDFAAAEAAEARLSVAAEHARGLQIAASGNLARLNFALRQAENALLSDGGLPNRPWYRHVIYAPGEYTGYSAVALPGVNEALDAHDLRRAAQQLAILTQALDRAAQVLQSAH